jgi:hypothetical protein
MAECFRSALTMAPSRIGNYSVVRGSHGVSPLGVCRCVSASNRSGDIHLQDRIAAAMLAKDHELFAQPPAIETIDVLTSKLHG